MSVQVISDELAARLDNMTPETRAMRFGKVLQNMQNAVNEQAAVGPMIYKGTWNASTNTPTLADGTGDNGNTYRVSVAGSQDLGAGSISFSVDDRVIYSGTTWEKWDANDAVQSVHGRAGAVTAQEGDYSAHYQPLITSGTAQATTSGTSIDFTSIPSTVKRITIMLDGVSTNGTSHPGVQIGDSGGVETSGYLGACQRDTTGTDYTNCFEIDQSNNAARTVYGSMILTMMDPATNTWACQGIFGVLGGAAMTYTAGTKSLSGILDRVRLTTVGGTDTFDAGKVNILYE